MPSTEEDNKDDWEKDDEEEDERDEEQDQGDFVEEGLRQRRVWRGEENRGALYQ